MNVLKKSILLGGCVAALTLGAGNQLMAQGRGDPTQWRQDRMERLRKDLDIKDDAEWTAIEPKITKVMDAERDVLSMRMGGMFGRGPRRGGGEGSTNGSSSEQPQRQRNNGFGEQSATVSALRKALDDKTTTTADIKAKLVAVRAEIKEKETKLEAAQEDLRSVLTSRQEAVAVVSGLLK
jgi:flagellar motility protein MotE (MotC chaperone)